MKKIAFIGVILLLVLSFSTTYAHAASCAPGDKFSSETGLPCLHAPCSPGDLYNSQTGEKCIITDNQSSNMSENNTSSVSNTGTQSTQVTLPKITNQLIPNNRSQVFSIKTNVPTTVTIEYADYTAMTAAQGPLFTGIGGQAEVLPLFIQWIADGSNVLLYTDSTLTTDHEIPYSALNLVPNDLYFTKVTVTDAIGNDYSFDGYQNPGDTDGTLNSWDTFSAALSTNTTI